ncbi:cellulose synthase operon protein c [Anaeramoeba flamelloides]|uniref:Cellulose synthase operon protein c n=1 Tax=Anaeramoeba flamelloides TaxID=1746091 RepID=A0ABQ8YLK4_9EUKA|nr:cellulose synthase operon protein c [Anaeramoeba flamelloides]
MLSNFGTWFQKNKTLVLSLTEFFTGLNLDLNLVKQNPDEFKKGFELLGKLDIFGAARELIVGCGIDSTKADEALDLLKEIVEIVDDIATKNISKGIFEIKYVLLIAHKVLRLLNCGEFIQAFEQILGSFKVDFEKLWEVSLQLEQGNKSGLGEQLIQLFGVKEEDMEKMEHLKTLENFIKRGPNSTTLPAVVGLLGIEKSVVDKVKENFGRIMQFVEEENLPEKISQFIDPTTPNEDSINHAIDNFVNILKPSRNGKLWAWFGQSYLRRSWYSKASLCFEKALKADEENEDSEWFYNWGYSLIYEDKFDEAIEQLTEAIECKEEEPKYWNMRGCAKLRAGKEEDAMEDWKKADELKANDSYNLAWRGEMYSLMMKWDKAVEWFNKATDAMPQNSWAHYGATVAYLWLGNNEEAAKSSIKSSETMNFECQYQSIYYFLVNTLESISKKLYPKALFEIDHFEHCMKMKFNFMSQAKALFWKGWVLEQKGEKESAKKCWEQSKELYPLLTWTEFKLNEN